MYSILLTITSVLRGHYKVGEMLTEIVQPATPVKAPGGGSVCDLEPSMAQVLHHPKPSVAHPPYPLGVCGN